MPNWTDNSILIFGEPEVLDEIQEFMKTHVVKDGAPMEPGKSCLWHKALDESRVFDYNSLTPMPFSIRFGEGDGWYDWSKSNWGVKWNASDSVRERVSPGELRYSFLSPWGPPQDVCDSFAMKFSHKAEIHWEFNQEDGWKTPPEGLTDEEEEDFYNDPNNKIWESLY